MLVPRININAPFPEKGHISVLYLDHGVNEGGVAGDIFGKLHPRREHVPRVSGRGTLEARAVENGRRAVFVRLKHVTHVLVNALVHLCVCVCVWCVCVCVCVCSSGLTKNREAQILQKVSRF